MPFHNLPIELVLLILEEAACFSSREERAHAVNVALVSRRSYKLSRRTLYRKLEITDTNFHLFRGEENLTAMENVLAHVAYMSFPIRGNLPPNERHDEMRETLFGVLDRWNPPRGGEAFLDASWEYTSHLSEHRPKQFRQLRGVDISYNSLLNAARMLAHCDQSLTYIVGFLPPTRESSVEQMRMFAYELALSMPRVTHLGLKYTAAHNIGPVSDYLGALKEAIAALLQVSPTLRLVVLRISGPNAVNDADKVEFISMVEKIGDSRVVLWFEPCEDLSNFHSNKDCWAGRDFWTRCGVRDMWDLKGRGLCID